MNRMQVLVITLNAILYVSVFVLALMLKDRDVLSIIASQFASLTFLVFGALVVKSDEYFGIFNPTGLRSHRSFTVVFGVLLPICMLCAAVLSPGDFFAGDQTGNPAPALLGVALASEWCRNRPPQGAGSAGRIAAIGRDGQSG